MLCTRTVVSVEQINKIPRLDLQFPASEDLVNYTTSNVTSEIIIPTTFVEERLQEVKKLNGIVTCTCMYIASKYASRYYSYI